MEIFKKGQIVPRRINIVGVDKQKKRHLWKFGGTVKVEGRKLTLLDGDCCLELKRDWVGGKRGKPKEFVRSSIKNVHVVGVSEVGFKLGEEQ